ncbi:MAG: DRTGG domain-containing protein [Caldicoprobacterales bacterium]|jgi:predicted transcriptional regulator
MIKLEELINELDLEVLSEGVSLDREVLSGCCCDLLSWVMAHGKRNAIWITVQAHVNVVAVASLLELSGVILPSGVTMDEKTIEKAQEEGVTILSSKMDAFQLSGMLYKLGVGSER